MFASGSSLVVQPCTDSALLLAQPSDQGSPFLFTWSGVQLPTLAITALEKPIHAADVTVDCASLREGHVQDVIDIPAGVRYHQSTTFASLLEFSGKSLELGTFIRRMVLDELQFKAVNISAPKATLASKGGLVQIDLEVRPAKGIAKENPHNFFDANSFSIDLVLHNFDYANATSRLAMEVVASSLERSVSF